jgi:hypothetical protein
MLNRGKRRFGIKLIALIAFLIPATAEARPRIRWYAGLDPADHSKVLVQIDTRRLEPNVVTRDIRLAVGFYRQDGKALGGRHFTDPSLAAVSSGKFIEKRYPNPYPTATSALGLALTANTGASGQYMSGGWLLGSQGIVFQFSTGLSPNAGPLDLLNPDLARRILVARTTLEFPGAGTRNNGAAIGPFCCSGETAVVKDISGNVVGHVNLYGFSGGRMANGRHLAESVRVNFSAKYLTAPDNNDPLRANASFSAAGWTPGTSANLELGILSYSVRLHPTIQSIDGRKYFDMGLMRATVEVAQAD